MSDEFFQNSFFESKIVISTLQFVKIIFYIKPQPKNIDIQSYHCCYCFFFYIKPQHTCQICTPARGCYCFFFYIKPQRLFCLTCVRVCCYCFFFYIKPQPRDIGGMPTTGCYCFFFYIKPQPLQLCFIFLWVVIVFFSTSNHNLALFGNGGFGVVIVFFSTSNHNLNGCNACHIWLLLFFFLHQTTTVK